MGRRGRTHRKTIEADWRPIVEPAAPSSPHVPDGGSWERKTPVREPTIAADWGVPLLTALTLAASAGLAVAVVPPLFTGVTFWESWRFGVASAVIILPLSFLGVRSVVESSIWQVEELIGADIDGDQQVGRPSTTIELYSDTRNPGDRPARSENGDTWQHMDRLRVDVAPEKLKQFAEAMNRGASLSVSRWTNGANGIFTRGEFDSMIDELSQRGLIEYKNPETPQLGRRVTERGEDVFSQIAQRQLPAPDSR